MLPSILSSADPFLYEGLLADVGDVADALGKQHGGWYSFGIATTARSPGAIWSRRSFPAPRERSTSSGWLAPHRCPMGSQVC